jgi:hypothetical protein
MNDLDAVMAIETEQLTEEEYVEYFQQLIDSGTVWGLQGSYGRTAMMLIDMGLCEVKS